MNIHICKAAWHKLSYPTKVFALITSLGITTSCCQLAFFTYKKKYNGECKQCTLKDHIHSTFYDTIWTKENGFFRFFRIKNRTFNCTKCTSETRCAQCRKILKSHTGILPTIPC